MEKDNKEAGKREEGKGSIIQIKTSEGQVSNYKVALFQDLTLFATLVRKSLDHRLCEWLSLLPGCRRFWSIPTEM